LSMIFHVWLFHSLLVFYFCSAEGQTPGLKHALPLSYIPPFSKVLLDCSNTVWVVSNFQWNYNWWMAKNKMKQNKTPYSWVFPW
jgi:hypothetical protein